MADLDKMRFRQDFLVFIVPAQNGVIKLKIPNHPDNAEVLSLCLRKGSLKIFFENVKVFFYKFNPQPF